MLKNWLLDGESQFGEICSNAIEGALRTGQLLATQADRVKPDPCYLTEWHLA